MINDSPTSSVIRIINTIEGEDFNRMLHQIGGNVSMFQKAQNSGDELLFENIFYKTLFHLIVFENNQMTVKESGTTFGRKPSFDDLPKNGAAVIDTSDRALYFFISNSSDTTPEEDQTVEMALTWMNSQPEYSNREIFVFSPDYIPPNIAIIFGVNK